MAKKSKKKSGITTVNFAGVESGAVVVPEGKYEVEVVAVSEEIGQNSNEPYLAFELKITEGKQEGKKLYLNKSLQENSLWSLKQLLEVLGADVPDDEMDIDHDDLVGRTCGVEVAHEKYNGKNKAQITDVFDVAASDEEDDTPKKKKPKKVEDEDEEEDEEDTKSSKKGKSKAKDEDEEEVDSDDEDDKPAKKAKKGKKSKTYTEDAILEYDEEELQGLIDEHELDVDLEEYNTVRRKRASVLEAMNEQGLVE